jgi:hypothetical protein
MGKSYLLRPKPPLGSDDVVRDTNISDIWIEIGFRLPGTLLI